jgi:hypothetical protein
MTMAHGIFFRGVGSGAERILPGKQNGSTMPIRGSRSFLKSVREWL